MAPLVTLLKIRWEGVADATGYEIFVNGLKVASTGPKARTTQVAVGTSTKVEIVDLPARKSTQVVEFSQVSA